MYSGIYRIHFGGGRSYIGRTCNLVKRKKQHLNSLRRGTHPNPHLQNAFRKYGEEVLEFKVVLFCRKEECLKWEKFFLDSFSESWGALYNISRSEGHPSLVGEDNPMYGKKRSEETKRKISEKMSGSNHHMKGKRHTEEARAKMRKANAVFSEEHLRKLSEAKRGKKLPKEQKEKILLSNPQRVEVTVEGVTYPSLNEASRVTGISYHNLKKFLE